MAQLSDFDAIRPYSDDEVWTGIDELLGDRQFRAIIHGMIPWLPYSIVRRLLRLSLIGVRTTRGFQGRLMRPMAKYILWRHADGCTYIPNAHNTWEQRYTFVSNHRDIILDVALFNLMLYERHAPALCEIAIGDNLLVFPWIKCLVRLNKAFIVQRSLPTHEKLQGSLLLSQYMHYALTELRENIWIAQREGRAKDSADNTQESVLKMMTLWSDTSSPIEAIREMNIVPLTISYEYDPCDYLKAQEFQLKRDNITYKKSRQDDLINMRTGMFGYKGRIVYQPADCINTWLDTLQEMPYNDFFHLLAQHLDSEIHSHYTLYPNNYLADDMLNGNKENSAHYTNKDKQRFEKYLAGQMDKISLTNKDIPFLRERLLTMYANPLRNYRRAKNNKEINQQK